MLIENIRECEYGGFEGETYLNDRDGKVRVKFPSEAKREYAEKCVEYLQNMDKDMTQRLAKYAYRFFKDLSKDFDDDDYGTFIDMPQNVSEEDILKYVQFDSIIIEEECREDRIEFHAGGGCDWEIEHGFEFTVSDGKILYVGPFEDMPPNNPERFAYYGFYDENADPIMNYADKEI